MYLTGISGHARKSSTCSLRPMPVSYTHLDVYKRQAKLILRTLGLRKGGIEVVSCPTCGRTQIDLIGLANQDVYKRQEILTV